MLVSCCLLVCMLLFFLLFFFFNDTATTEIYTLSLHDALPICTKPACLGGTMRYSLVRMSTVSPGSILMGRSLATACFSDRKSTRLNSSHTVISYAVFCLKKKKKIKIEINTSQNNTLIVMNTDY